REQRLERERGDPGERPGREQSEGRDRCRDQPQEPPAAALPRRQRGERQERYEPGGEQVVVTERQSGARRTGGVAGDRPLEPTESIGERAERNRGDDGGERAQAAAACALVDPRVREHGREQK